MADDFDFDTKNLDGLIKALKTNMKKVRVGILGSDSIRHGEQSSGSGRSVNAANSRPKKFGPMTTNAAIGAVHEFGTEKMPMRSFLRVPISEHLQSELERSKAFDQDAAKQVMKEASFLPWLMRLRDIGVNIVLEAFATGGYGKWPKWKTPGYQNNTGQLLQDTQQLRNSITGDIK
jgi:phage gpG-like protein